MQPNGIESTTQIGPVIASKGAIKPVVNYIIDKETQLIHKFGCTQELSSRIVTAEDLNPAYVTDHGYSLCEICK